MNDNNTTTDFEAMGREFLAFVAKNEKELKKALQKNVTYNDMYFEDCFSDAVLKVYDAITKKHVIIKDFKQYFYIACKWEYVLNDNRYKKLLEQNLREFFSNPRHDIIDEDSNEEERFNMILLLLSDIRKSLEETYGKEDTDLFFSYFRAKTQSFTASYRDFAISDRPADVRFVSEKIRRMRAHVFDVFDDFKFKLSQYLYYADDTEIEGQD